MPNLDDVLHEFRDVIPLVGPLPSLATVPSTAVPSVDPRTVAAQVIGFDLNLDTADRASVIDALVHAFPVQIDKATQKAVVKPAAAREALTLRRSAVPLVGPMNVAAVALQSLADYAEEFDVGALRSCEGGCGPEPLVGLIRRTVRELAENFNGGRNPHAVDSALVTLAGFDVDGKGFPADPGALGGYLRQLRDSCHIDANTVCCGIEGEQSVTRFNTLVGLTSIFARAWLDARNDQKPSRYFAVNVHEVHQHLFGVVSTLERLRRAVAPEYWVTAEIPSNPPITAATLWDWMHRYCASTALEMLRHGCDGKTAVHDRMNKFDELVSALIKGPDSPCGLRAFHDKDVQELVKDLQCHVQKVRDATRKAAAY